MRVSVASLPIDPKVRERRTLRHTYAVVGVSTLAAVAAAVGTRDVRLAILVGCGTLAALEAWQRFGGARVLVQLRDLDGQRLRIDGHDAHYVRIGPVTLGGTTVRAGKRSWRVSESELRQVLAAILPHLNQYHTDAATLARASARVDRGRPWTHVLGCRLAEAPEGVWLAELEDEERIALEVAVLSVSSRAAL